MQQNLGPLSQHPHPGPSHHPAPPEPKARLSGSAGAVHMGGREGGRLGLPHAVTARGTVPQS